MCERVRVCDNVSMRVCACVCVCVCVVFNVSSALCEKQVVNELSDCVKLISDQVQLISRLLLAPLLPQLST